MAPPRDASPTATAANLLTLGLLADTVLLAASRDGPGAFTRGERAAFASAGGLLMQVRSFCAAVIPDGEALRSRPPLAMLEEVFDAATRNCERGSLETCLETLAGSLEAVSAGAASETQRESVVVFFGDVSSATLRRASDLRWRRHRRPLHERPGRRAVSASVA